MLSLANGACTRMVNRIRRLAAETLESRQLLAGITADQAVYGPVQPTRASADYVVPIPVDTATTARAAEIRIRYDANRLSIDPAQISPGGFWNRRATLVVNVDDQAGEIHAFLYTAEPVTSRDREVIKMEFTPRDQSDKQSPQQIEIRELRFDEGENLVVDDSENFSGPSGNENVDQIMREQIMQEQAERDRGHVHSSRFFRARRLCPSVIR